MCSLLVDFDFAAAGGVLYGGRKKSSRISSIVRIIGFGIRAYILRNNKKKTFDSEDHRFLIVFGPYLN